MSGPLGFGDDGGPEREPGPPEAERRTPAAPPPARPPNTSRYTWFVGVVAVLFLALVTLNALRGQGADPGGPQAGDKLAPFAVPLADAPPRKDGNEDANLNLEKACGVRGAGILNMCEQAERGPVVFALFPGNAPRCRSVLRQFDRLAPRHPGVRFVAVGSRGERNDLGRAHAFGVGWDRDGGVATTYGLVGCPQITFARRGGEVVETTHQALSDAEIVERVRRLTG